MNLEPWALMQRCLRPASARKPKQPGPVPAPAAGPSPPVPPSSPAATPSGVVVRELAGGCLCCTLSGPLGVAIAQLVRQTKPDRLLIEPSGLGHPAGLLDTLYGEHLRSALDVKAVICLVDVRAAAAELSAAAAEGPGGPGPAASDGGGGGGGGGIGGSGALAAAAVPNETFQASFWRHDQINVADVLVGHKADLASPDQLDAFWRWAEQLYPPKAQVELACHGRIDPSLLNLRRTPVFRPLFRPESHRSSSRRTAQRAAAKGPSAATAAAAAALPPSAAAVPAAATSPSPATAPAAAATTASLSTTHGYEDDGARVAAAVAATHLAEAEGDEEVRPGAIAGDTAAEPPIQLRPGKPLRFPSALPPAPLAPQGQQPQQPQPQQQQQGQQEVESLEPGGVQGAGEEAERVGGVAASGFAGPGSFSCGWLFSSEDVFERGRLAAVLAAMWPAAARLKGIFRVGKSSYVVPYLQADGSVELRPVSYRRESRLEVIVRSPQYGGGSAAAGTGGPEGPSLESALARADWEEVERALVEALAAQKRG
ncbi:hypothetical protein PLESTB_000325600 [Pleodorina starrii]|uniref:CobW C-terminal domain-containing protein n=1 Tax=Pleodorina starrii TaxID=330485 RepID=A0A9W6BD38_9CHLO|nr:hypothetical protein PLESTB_000325600 [Pleodorina starrii]GLC75069.1 hypothetical protein PLESTF_001590700 [Pleodorina starrii]